MQAPSILSPCPSPEYFPSAASVLSQYCPSIALSTAPHTVPNTVPVLFPNTSSHILPKFCPSSAPELSQYCPQHCLSIVSVLLQLPQHCLSTTWALVWQQGGKGDGEHVRC